MTSPFPNGARSELAAVEGSLSFRDPGGMLIRCGDRLFRLVKPHAAQGLLVFLESLTARTLLSEGRLIGTTLITPPEVQRAFGTELSDCALQIEGGLTLEHERISFPSFAYEWPPEMLHASAVLTLDLAQHTLRDGFGLKDATPYNILFRGPEPVFVDVLSFERRDPGKPIWRPYAQFVRTFVLPLLLTKHYGLRLDQTLTTRRDGLEPDDVYRLLKAHDKLRPPFLTLVTVPKWLGQTLDKDNVKIYRRKVLVSSERAHFVLNALFRGLRRALRRAAPGADSASAWSDYMRGGSNYSPEQFAGKQDFVEGVLREYAPKRVLDVGCNTGHFSVLAAAAGASVVAIDRDPVAVGQTWRTAKSKRLDILPLVVDLCRPSPPTGWLNKECPSFLDRARGSFDTVLMLAVLHHMLVTERIPLDRILALASELTTDLLVMEFIGPDDSMFRRLLRGREELHHDLTLAAFETACRSKFDIVRSHRLPGSSRWLYLLRRHGR